MASELMASCLPYLLDGAYMVVGTFLLFTGVLGTIIHVPKCKSNVSYTVLRQLDIVHGIMIVAEMYSVGSATPETWVLMPAATG